MRFFASLARREDIENPGRGVSPRRLTPMFLFNLVLDGMCYRVQEVDPIKIHDFAPEPLCSGTDQTLAAKAGSSENGVASLVRR